MPEAPTEDEIERAANRYLRFRRLSGEETNELFHETCDAFRGGYLAAALSRSQEIPRAAGAGAAQSETPKE